MIDMGFLMKRRRPLMPAYLLRQPADHSRTTYSVPKKSTSTISCREQTESSKGLIHPHRDETPATRTGPEDVEAEKALITASIQSKLKPLESITKIYRPI